MISLVTHYPLFSLGSILLIATYLPMVIKGARKLTRFAWREAALGISAFAISGGVTYQLLIW